MTFALTFARVDRLLPPPYAAPAIRSCRRAAAASPRTTSGDIRPADPIAVPQGLPWRAHRADAGVAEPPGRALHARVPPGKGQHPVARLLQDAGAGRDRDLRCPAHPRCRCRDHVRRPAARARADGPGARLPARCGAEVREPRAHHRARRRPAGGAGEGRHGLHRGDGQAHPPRAAGEHPADRVRRCALHPRLLCDRGAGVARVPAHEALHVRRRWRLEGAHGEAGGTGRGLRAAADRGGCAGGADLRLLGGLPLGGGLPGVRPALHPGTVPPHRRQGAGDLLRYGQPASRRRDVRDGAGRDGAGLAYAPRVDLGSPRMHGGAGQPRPDRAVLDARRRSPADGPHPA